MLKQRSLYVNHAVTIEDKPLIKTFENKNIDTRDIEILSDAIAVISINVAVTEWYVLPPLLFNAYSEEILKKTLPNETAYIKIISDTLTQHW